MSGNAIIRLRRDTAANWTAGNPVLALGEPGFETDTHKTKVGDGATAWAGLSYLTAVASSIIDGDYGDISITAGVWSIDPGTVSLAKMANMATGSLFYRKTAGAGAPEVQSLATLKTDLGLTGTNSGDQTITLTGDVTGSGTGSFVTAIGANKVTRGMLAQATGATLLGAIAAGNVADLTAAQAKTFLSIASTDVSGLGTAAVAATGTSGHTIPFLDGANVFSDINNFSAGIRATGNVGAGAAGLAVDIYNDTANGFVRAFNSTSSAYVPLFLQGSTINFNPSGGSTIFSVGATGITVTGTQTVGTTVVFNSSGVLQAAAFPALTGDVTTSAGALGTTIAAGAVSLAKMANLAANSFIGNNTGSPATPIAMTVAQAKTLLAIAESDVTNLTTDLAAKAPLANPEFTGVAFYQQPSPTARNSTTTLTIADLLTLIITSTSTTAVSLTLPTGTLTDAGILSGALPNNEGFEWVLINLGSSSGAVTLVAGTNHTIVGQAVTPIGSATVSGVSRWFTRKTATNTFITYRIG